MVVATDEIRKVDSFVHPSVGSTQDDFFPQQDKRFFDSFGGANPVSKPDPAPAAESSRTRAGEINGTDPGFEPKMNSILQNTSKIAIPTQTPDLKKDENPWSDGNVQRPKKTATMLLPHTPTTNPPYQTPRPTFVMTTHLVILTPLTDLMHPMR